MDQLEYLTRYPRRAKLPLHAKPRGEVDILQLRLSMHPLAGWLTVELGARHITDDLFDRWGGLVLTAPFQRDQVDRALGDAALLIGYCVEANLNQLPMDFRNLAGDPALPGDPNVNT